MAPTARTAAYDSIRRRHPPCRHSRRAPSASTAAPIQVASIAAATASAMTAARDRQGRHPARLPTPTARSAPTAPIAGRAGIRRRRPPYRRSCRADCARTIAEPHRRCRAATPMASARTVRRRSRARPAPKMLLLECAPLATIALIVAFDTTRRRRRPLPRHRYRLLLRRRFRRRPSRRPSSHHRPSRHPCHPRRLSRPARRQARHRPSRRHSFRPASTSAWTRPVGLRTTRAAPTTARGLQPTMPGAR